MGGTLNEKRFKIVCTETSKYLHLCAGMHNEHDSQSMHRKCLKVKARMMPVGSAIRPDHSLLDFEVFNAY